jgi:acetyl-CoA synthetase
MMRTMWGDHDRFIDTYFTMYKDIYFTGDGCRIDRGWRLLADGAHR